MLHSLFLNGRPICNHMQDDDNDEQKKIVYCSKVRRLLIL